MWLILTYLLIQRERDVLRIGGRSVFHFTHVFTKILRLWFGPLVNKWHLNGEY